MAYLELGSTPCDEECAQVGSENYAENVKKESQRYIRQLKRQFPEWEVKGVSFGLKSFQHDFGTYHEVVVRFDEMNDEACSYAYHIEDNLPANWEEEKPFIHVNGVFQMNPYA